MIVGNNAFVPDDRIDSIPPRGDTESQLPPALPDGRGFGPSIKDGLHGTLSRVNPDKKNFSLLFGVGHQFAVLPRREVGTHYSGRQRRISKWFP